MCNWVDGYLRDDEPENEGLTEHIHAIVAQSIEVVLPVPLPSPVT